MKRHASLFGVSLCACPAATRAQGLLPPALLKLLKEAVLSHFAARR
jgi:hypothetical protein